MTVNKKNLTMAFQFNATSQEVRSLFIDHEPFFVAKDVCSILDLSDTNKALAKLDSDEKLTRKIFGSGQNRKMWLVSESGLYALIMRSNKPEAKTFRKWVTKEVLPSIRKKGYYGNKTITTDFIDAREVPYTKISLNKTLVRTIVLASTKWFSVNDVHKAIGSCTSSNQTAKKLNSKSVLAKKIWIFGNTHPSWFTNELGVKLLISSSRKLVCNQLKLKL